MTQIVAGFFNTQINQTLANNACDCCDGAYSMPFKEGEALSVFVQDSLGFADFGDFELPEGLIEDANEPYTQPSATLRIYAFFFVGTARNSRLGFRMMSNTPKPISTLCGLPLSDLCSYAINKLCNLPLSGTTCFYVAGCYESIFTYNKKIENTTYSITQRLPIRVYNPQPKIDGIKTYQKTNGAIMRTGRARLTYEYTLETDYMPDLFHRQLLEVLMSSENIVINGKNYTFGGDYQINYAKNSKIMRATCKMIENQGIYNC